MSTEHSPNREDEIMDKVVRDSIEPCESVELQEPPRPERRDDQADAVQRNANGSAPPDSGTGGLLSMEDFRLSQSFEGVTSAPVQPVIQLRRPDAEWFVRAHPTHWIELGFIETGATGAKEFYLVSTSLHSKLADEPLFRRKWLYLGKSAHGVLFVWHVNPTEGGGRGNTWNDSALAAVEKARAAWVRVYSDREAQQYLWREAVDEIAEPEWPSTDFDAIVMEAVREKIIADENHPVLRTLRGAR